MRSAVRGAAVRVLRERQVAFTEHEYRYEEQGGTSCMPWRLTL
jgi:hypothetical protein